MVSRTVTLLCIIAVVIPYKVGGQVVQFVNSDLTLQESEGNTSVCVELIGDISSNAPVLVSSDSATATVGIDYEMFDDELLEFTPGGPKMLCLQFVVFVDNTLESTEVVTITLRAPPSSPVTVGGGSLTINILDSDRITIGFERSSYTAREGGEPAEVCAIRLIGTVNRQLIVVMSALPQAMSNGTASDTPGSLDYSSMQTESLTLESGATRVCAEFGSFDDNLNPILEELEFYQVSLTTSDTAVIDPSRSIANIFIDDNEGATVTIVNTSISVQEGNIGRTPIMICVRLTNILSGLMRELIYQIIITLGTADAGDITPIDPQTLKFPSSSVVGDTECVTYEIIGDDYKEFDENLTATLVREKSDDIIDNASPDIPITILDDGDLVQFCEELQAPENGNVSFTGTREQSTADYTCDQGYFLIGNSQRTCQRDPTSIPGMWSGLQPICIIPNCSLPPMPNDMGVTQVTFTDTTYLSEATYSCPNDCYQLIPNTPIATCQANESWSLSSAPMCQISDCGLAPEYMDCAVNATGTTCGSMALYTSTNTSAIRIFGDTELVCGTNGMWQVDPGQRFPFCIPSGICPEPPTPVSDDCLVRILPPEFNSLARNAVANYSCPAGCLLTPSNATSRTCMEHNDTSGYWSDDTPTCTGVTCNSLPNPMNGNVDSTMRRFMDNATYTCNLGFMPAGSDVRQCQADGTWSGVAPRCVPVECPNLTLANGDVSVDNMNPGDMAIYTCDEGYSIEGMNTRECMSNGEWSGDEPQCLLDCGNDTEVIERNVTENTDFSLNHGSIITHTCMDGCSVTRTCYNGTWNGELPTCPASRCSILMSEDERITITHTERRANSNATYTCSNGIVGDNNRTCQCNGEWTEPIPVCDAESGGGLSTGAIIGIAIAAAVILIILLILLICCIAYCVRSRKNYDKQLDNAYREFMRPYNPPYDTTNAPVAVAPQTKPESTQQVEEMEKEILGSESNLIDEDDDLPSPTPSDEDMDEYRLRMRDVETQSTGSQHRIKPRIVAEKVEVEVEI